MKRLKLKTFASDDVIKKDNIKTTPLLIYYVKLYVLHPLLISALILEFLSESPKLKGLICALFILHCIPLPAVIHLALSSEGEELPLL